MDNGALMERIYRLINQYQAAQKQPRRYGETVLHAAETHMLEVIGGQPGVRATELAARLAVTKGAASQTIRRLTDKGLIRRDAGEDARVACFTLTEAGERIRAQHRALHAPMLAQVQALFMQLSPEAGAALLALADVLENHFTQLMQEEKHDAD